EAHGALLALLACPAGCSHTLNLRQLPGQSGSKIDGSCAAFTAQVPREVQKTLLYTASFAAFTGRARMIFRAGLALNTVGSFVNGLMPFRSLVAGFFMTTNLAKPGTTKAPFFFSSL